MSISETLLSCMLIILLTSPPLIISYIFYNARKISYKERKTIQLLKDKIFEKDSVNVIIAHTPLQVKVAGKIIDNHPNEKFYFILASLNYDERYQHYINEICKKTDKIYFFSYYNRSSITLLDIKLRSFLLPKVKTFFICNIHWAEIHTIVDTHPNAQIKTYDDGTINLVKTSYFLENKDLDWAHKGLEPYYKIFSKKTTLPILREKSEEHFTIFKDFHNIMNNGKRKITPIDLFDYKKIKPSDNIQNTVKILLGTKEENLKNTSENVIKKFNIQYLIPHPSQKYQLNDVITVKTPLMAEDFILQEIRKNPNTQYEIYTFFSGAALNMKNFPNVKIFSIKTEDIPEDKKELLSPIYDFFVASNIPIIEL